MGRLTLGANKRLKRHTDVAMTKRVILFAVCTTTVLRKLCDAFQVGNDLSFAHLYKTTKDQLFEARGLKTKKPCKKLIFHFVDQYVNQSGFIRFVLCERFEPTYRVVSTSIGTPIYTTMSS